MALKHWTVTTDGGPCRVEADHCSVVSGVLVFYGREQERFSPRNGQPLPPRAGTVTLALAPGEWSRAVMDDGESHDA